MFGASYFGKSYFGGNYWGPNVEIIAVVQAGTSQPSGGGRNLAYTVRRKILPKSAFEADRQKHIDQLVREDEEIIQIIVKLIEAGTI